jgi:hypothetical protein
MFGASPCPAALAGIGQAFVEICRWAVGDVAGDVGLEGGQELRAMLDRLSTDKEAYDAFVDDFTSVAPPLALIILDLIQTAEGAHAGLPWDPLKDIVGPSIAALGATINHPEGWFGTVEARLWAYAIFGARMLELHKGKAETPWLLIAAWRGKMGFAAQQSRWLTVALGTIDHAMYVNAEYMEMQEAESGAYIWKCPEFATTSARFWQEVEFFWMPILLGWVQGMTRRSRWSVLRRGDAAAEAEIICTSDASGGYGLGGVTRAGTVQRTWTAAEQIMHIQNKEGRAAIEVAAATEEVQWDSGSCSQPRRIVMLTDNSGASGDIERGGVKWRKGDDMRADLFPLIVQQYAHGLEVHAYHAPGTFIIAAGTDDASREDDNRVFARKSTPVHVPAIAGHGTGDNAAGWPAWMLLDMLRAAGCGPAVGARPWPSPHAQPGDAPPQYIPLEAVWWTAHGTVARGDPRDPATEINAVSGEADHPGPRARARDPFEQSRAPDECCADECTHELGRRAGGSWWRCCSCPRTFHAACLGQQAQRPGPLAMQCGQCLGGELPQHIAAALQLDATAAFISGGMKSAGSLDTYGTALRRFVRELQDGTATDRYGQLAVDDILPAGPSAATHAAVVAKFIHIASQPTATRRPLAKTSVEGSLAALAWWHVLKSNGNTEGPAPSHPLIKAAMDAAQRLAVAGGRDVQNAAFAMPIDTMVAFQTFMINEREQREGQWRQGHIGWGKWYEISRDWAVYALEYGAVLRTNEPVGVTFGGLQRCAEQELAAKWWEFQAVTKTSRGKRIKIQFEENASGVDVLGAVAGVARALRAGGWAEQVENGTAPLAGDIREPTQALKSMDVIMDKSKLVGEYIAPFCRELGHEKLAFDRNWAGYTWRRGGINAARQDAYRRGLRGEELLDFVLARGRWKSFHSALKYLLDVDDSLAGVLRKRMDASKANRGRKRGR